MRWLGLLICAATGCDWVVGISRLEPGSGSGVDAGLPFDDGGHDAAINSDCRHHVDFTLLPATMFPGLATGYVPTITADLTDVFDVDTPNGYDLREFHLEGGTFVPVATDYLNTPSLEDDPALTGDGLDLIFVSTREGSQHAYEATRSALASPWSTPNQLMGINGAAIFQVDLSPDGLTLYLVNASNDLYQANRMTRTSPFMIVGLVASAARYPTVSGDGLELIMESAGNVLGAGLFEAVRDSTQEPFGSFTPIASLPVAFDVDLSPDSHYLMTGGGQSFVRDCQ